MGGECLNTGCVPSKALLAAAAHASAIESAQAFGMEARSHVDFARVHAHVHEVIDAIAPHDSEHLVVIGGGPLGIELAQAHRRLGSRVTVLVTSRAMSKDDPDVAAVLLKRPRGGRDCHTRKHPRPAHRAERVRHRAQRSKRHTSTTALRRRFFSSPPAGRRGPSLWSSTAPESHTTARASSSTIDSAPARGGYSRLVTWSVMRRSLRT